MRKALWAATVILASATGAKAQYYGGGGNYGPYNSGFGITAPGTSRSLSLGGPYLGGYYGSSYGGNPGYGYRTTTGYSSGYDRSGYTGGYSAGYRSGYSGRWWRR